MAPTAMKTVPSGVLVVCKYGAPAVGGTVTIGAAVDVEDDDVEVDVVSVETDDVVELSVAEEVSVESVVVESILVDVADVSDVVLAVFSDLEEVGSVVAAEVSVTLGMLSVVEGSSVVWVASVVASSVVRCADTQVTSKSTRTKIVVKVG